MIRLRLAFYALYIVLGLAIMLRILAMGLHWQALSGVILGALLVALGAYRIASFVRRRSGIP